MLNVCGGGHNNKVCTILVENKHFYCNLSILLPSVTTNTNIPKWWPISSSCLQKNMVWESDKLLGVIPWHISDKKSLCVIFFKFHKDRFFY